MDSFEIQKYINMAIKRKWWIIIPFLVVLLGGFTYLLVTPRIYEASTLILVQQQKVPEDIVQSVVSTSINDRLATIQQQVTSRTNLEGIIEEYGLYESPKKYVLIDSKVEDFRNAINIQTSKDSSSRNSEISAFTISFRYDDPRKAMDVTNKLASNFISENLVIREEQALGTSTFLADALKDAEEQLKQKEEELKQYQERYMGGLPDQLETNLSILERLQTNLDQLNTNLRDAENRRTAILKDIADSNAGVSVQSSQSGQGARQVDELALRKSELASLESRYTANHPDVVRLKQSIAAMEKERAEAQPQSDSTADEDVSAIETITVDQSLKHQLQEINIDIANYKADIEETNSQIKWYQQKVADTPKRQQELLSLNRDYENLKASYSSLLDRKLETDLSVSMEKKQKGEQFRVLDSAKIPEKPVAPDVKKIALMTLVLGLGLGCGLAYLMEMMDTSFRTPDETEKETGLPILVNFPFILSEIEVKRIKKNNIFAYTGVSIGFILSVIGILVAVRGVDGTIEFFQGFLNL